MAGRNEDYTPQELTQLIQWFTSRGINIGPIISGKQNRGQVAEALKTYMKGLPKA